MGNNLLKGKKGIIFGALDENSIAWKVAEKAYKQGAQIVLTNSPIAIRMGKINELAEKTKAKVIGADATSLEDLDSLFEETKNIFGHIDFILHSIGMSVNVRKNIHYTETDYNNLTKGWDISAVSFHKVMQTARKHDIMNEWGSVVALSYIASQRVFPDYNDMADNKAYLESIARSFGYWFGIEKKIRVNTISQSPTPTTAGNGVKGFDGFLKYSDKMSPLGNATSDECADYTITLFSDFTRKVTMQNLFHDGGFSKMGISNAIMEQYIESESKKQ